MRRKLHNLVQELRGNIRVLVRVRPVLEHMASSASSCVLCPEDADDEIGIANEAYGVEKKWTFDKVLCDKKTQAQVYEEISPLVTSVLDGYNVCVFAYGQTGSGKTYSMQGDDHDWGIYRRTFAEFFTVIAERKSSDWKYALSASLLEVYNDDVFDLLNEQSVRKKLALRQGSGGVHVENLISRSVNNDGELSTVLALGQSNRAVGSTNLNEHSSRSHLIFQVTTEIVTPSGKQLSSKMNLIDLAGSSGSRSPGPRGTGPRRV